MPCWWGQTRSKQLSTVTWYLPGYYGCAHAYRDGQTTELVRCVTPCFVSLSFDFLFFSSDVLRLFLWHLWCSLRNLGNEAYNETGQWSGRLVAVQQVRIQIIHLVRTRMCIPPLLKRQPTENRSNEGIRKMRRMKATLGRTAINVHLTCNTSNGTTTAS